MTEQPTPTPPWLTAMVDERMAFMETELGSAAAALTNEFGLVMTLLTEPPEGVSEAEFQRWDRRCDRCGRFCTVGEDFFVGHTARELAGVRVLITFGVCPTCKDLP